MKKIFKDAYTLQEHIKISAEKRLYLKREITFLENKYEHIKQQEKELQQQLKEVIKWKSTATD